MNSKRTGWTDREGSVVLSGVGCVCLIKNWHFNKYVEEVEEVRFECFTAIEHRILPIIRSLALPLTWLGDSGQVFCSFSYKIKTCIISTQDWGEGK